MKPIYPIEVEGEKVYLKKGFFGWRVVYPIRIDGKINRKNLLIGSSKQLLSLLIYLGIAAAIYFGLHQLIEQCEWIINNQVCYNITQIELPPRTLPSIVIP